MTYYELNNENIDQAVSTAQEFLLNVRMEKKELLRTRLLVEETLLNYQEILGQEGKFSLRCRSWMGTLKIEMTFPGESHTPFPQSDEDSQLMRRILSGLGYEPDWQYKNGANLVTLTLQKPKPSQLRVMLAAVEIGILCGFWGRILPPQVGSMISEGLLEPFFDIFMNLLSLVAGPMIFFSVAWGIYSIGDTATLSRIGKQLILRFVGIYVLISPLIAAAFAFFFPLENSGDAMVNFQEIRKLVLNIVPPDFVTPFAEGNPVQIIFLGIVAGLTALSLGSKIPVISAVIDQGNSFVQKIMGVVGALIPLFVFGRIFFMIVQGSFTTMIGAGKLILMVLAGCAAVCIFFLLLVSIRQKVSLKTLVKKTLPTALIGLATASSSVALASNMETCRKKLGVDSRVTNFGVPLGQVVFMPGCIVLFLGVGLYMAEANGIPITFSWLLAAVVISVVLAVAAPPVPGGALTCYTMLFAQLGIPAGSMALLVTLNIALEFFVTATNLLSLQLELVDLSGKTELLNREVLLDRSK